MKLEQLYDEIFSTGELRITLAGRPGIGKTKVALQLASKYAEQTNKKILYITGKVLDDPIGRSRSQLIPESVCDNIIIWEELYRYCDDCHIMNKAISYCQSHDDIGLVIFDDEASLQINLSVVLHSFNMETLTDGRVPILFLASIDRKSERRRRCIPKLKDIAKPFIKLSYEVFAIYQEKYYYYETKPNASDEYEFIRLK